MDEIELQIVDYISLNPLSSSKEIHEGITTQIGYATIKRILKRLLAHHYLIIEGKGRATKNQRRVDYMTGLIMIRASPFLQERTICTILLHMKMKLSESLTRNTSTLRSMISVTRKSHLTGMK